MKIPRTARELIESNVNGALKLLGIALALDEQHPRAIHPLEEARISEAYWILENALSKAYHASREEEAGRGDSDGSWCAGSGPGV